MTVVLSDVEEAPLQDAVTEVTAKGAEAIGFELTCGTSRRLSDWPIEQLSGSGRFTSSATTPASTPEDSPPIPPASWGRVMEVDFCLVRRCGTFLPNRGSTGHDHASPD